MTQEFQLSLLSYLVQNKEGLTYIPALDGEIFDLVEDKLILQVLKKYIKTYNDLPSKVVAQQFLEEQLNDTPNLNKEIIGFMRENIVSIYDPIPPGDKQKLQDTIVLAVQASSIEKTFLDYASNKINSTQVFAKMTKLSSMATSNAVVDHEDGGRIIQDRYKHYDEQNEGNPTYLHDLNKLTAAGGFYPPQFVLFMSGPKAFKTGFLIVMGVEYARDGFNVYYADGENGARSIRNRAKQAIMKCSYQELYDPAVQEELDNTLYRFGHYMKGDIFIDSYPAGMKSISDVRNRLAYIKERHNWTPDIIIYDSIDHFIPSNARDQSRDTRIKIQLVYHEAINLNRELGTFCLAPSQVNREAINKKIFDMKDVSEDFGKIFNSHAVFAICSTPEEQEAGIKRIIPVVQREGVAYKGKNYCVIKVNEECMTIDEVDKDAYMEGLKDD